MQPATVQLRMGEQLAQEFSRFANEADLQDPLKVRRPSHLLPPTAVVAAQLDALQRNDWPDQDAGIRTAFLFAKPQECSFSHVVPQQSDDT
eukprot:jgi/Astpho2/9643/Aster-x0860